MNARNKQADGRRFSRQVNPGRCYRRHDRTAVVLLVVLVVTVMAAMTATGLMFYMRAESSAAGAQAGGDQAYAVAVSGLQSVIAVLEQSPCGLGDWYDNEQMFRNQFVTDDGGDRWYFTIFAYNLDDPDVVRFGLTDQAGKINVNVADERTLTALPNMTRELALAVIAYRGSAAGGSGAAESDGFSAPLEELYPVKRAPLATLEELLLIKGFDGRIVFGEDANMNCLLDANEDDGVDSFPADDGNGVLDRGLKGCATAVSYEPDVDNAGQARININGDLSELGKAKLSDETEQFIRLYIAEGNSFRHPSELLEMRYRLKNDVRAGGSSRGRRGRRRGRVTMRAGSWIESGVDGDNLAKVLDKLTTASGGRRRMLKGLLNVNTAGPEALSAIPGISESLAAEIIDARRQMECDDKATVAWLFARGLVDTETFKRIAPLLTARGYQYHLRCVGFGWPCGRFCVIEAIVDTAGSKPRVTYLRDITRLGLPFSIDMDESL